MKRTICQVLTAEPDNWQGRRSSRDDGLNCNQMFIIQMVCMLGTTDVLRGHRHRYSEAVPCVYRDKSLWQTLLSWNLITVPVQQANHST